jgi:hypothetical protein
VLLFHRNREQVEGDDLLIGEAQVGKRGVALDLRPTPFLPMFANRKVECYQL